MSLEFQLIIFEAYSHQILQLTVSKALFWSLAPGGCVAECGCVMVLVCVSVCVYIWWQTGETWYGARQMQLSCVDDTHISDG